jgi:hypothetical protein
MEVTSWVVNISISNMDTEIENILRMPVVNLRHDGFKTLSLTCFLHFVISSWLGEEMKNGK